jgi:hypothetical protein
LEDAMLFFAEAMRLGLESERVPDAFAAWAG